jgi:hypothetical protein
MYTFPVRFSFALFQYHSHEEMNSFFRSLYGWGFCNANVNESELELEWISRTRLVYCLWMNTATKITSAIGRNVLRYCREEKFCELVTLSRR